MSIKFPVVINKVGPILLNDLIAFISFYIVYKVKITIRKRIFFILPLFKLKYKCYNL